MARKNLIYRVAEEGRDKGKSFVLTEMDAEAAEDWGMRALLALMGAGVEMPDDFASLGMAGMVELGFKALGKLSWSVAKPLLNEMKQCIQFMPDSSKPHIVRGLFDGDIEEIPTLIKLRIEVWKLHVGFLKAGNQSTSGQEQAVVRTPNTKTSRVSSAA